MDFVTVRDLRIRPADVWRRLREKRDLLITSSGRPIAVMVGVGEGEDVEATLTALRRVRAQAAICRMRRSAAAKGLNRMTPEEVDAEIAAARQPHPPSSRPSPNTST
jgi:prevent-host-death family protein